MSATSGSAVHMSSDESTRIEGLKWVQAKATEAKKNGRKHSVAVMALSSAVDAALDAQVELVKQNQFSVNIQG